MAEIAASYEVEIRCRFDNNEEAYNTLPFLRSCLQREFSWITKTYGLTLFKSGQLLRVGELIEEGGNSYYLGWKGPDTGTFANIRLEVDEEITSGIENSVVMQMLGSGGSYKTPAEVTSELEALGHKEFMSFRGKDITGYDEEFDLKVKLLMCIEPKWLPIVELEKTAVSEEEARERETELREFCNRFHLQSRLVKEEPPTLLYQELFGREP